MDNRDLADRIAYSRFFYPIILLTGNKCAQTLLVFALRVIHHLMGIGTATAPSSSGEMAAVEACMKLLKPPYRLFDIGANVGDFS